MTYTTRTPGLAETLKALPDNYLLLDAESAKLSVVGASSALLGYFAINEADIIGMPLADVLMNHAPSKVIDRLVADIKRGVEHKGAPALRPIETTTKGDATATLCPSVYLVSGEEGSTQSVLLSLKEIEGSGIESDDLDDRTNLFAMADAIPHMSWIMQSDGKPIYYNKMWRDYANITDDNLTAFDWSAIVHPDDLPAVSEKWQRAIKTGKLFDAEMRLLHPETNLYHWFTSRALPARGEDGKIVHWFGTFTDIDEQKRAALIQSFLSQATKELGSSLDYEKTLNTITRLSVPEIADWCSVDLYDSETNEWNQVSLAHIDPTKVEMARKYRELHPIDPDDTMGIPAVVRSGKPEFMPYITDEALEAMVDTPEDLALVRELNIRAAIIAPIYIKNKASGAITFVSSDSNRQYTMSDLEMAQKLAGRISLSITNATVYKEAQEELEHRHELEKELREERDKLEQRVKDRTMQLEEVNRGLHAEIGRRKEAEDELKRSNQELQDFAYVASHDLQEPLRKIQAFGDILQGEYGDRLEEGAEYLSRMHAAASRMSRLIEDLLTFSRVTTRPPVPTEVDLNEVVAGVLVDLEEQVSRTGGRVEFGKLPIVLADPTHMRQLFQNLISNGLKFHKPDVPPVVTVSARPCSDRNCTNYEISVADNGIGFDQKYTDRIFGVFQRLHGRDGYEGTGIGLAVCRKIVERYGGTISAESRKGKGAKFTVKIPVAVKEAKDDG